MKRFIVCIWFGLVFSFLYGAAVSFDDMRERIAYDPLGSLASLDSLETDLRGEKRSVSICGRSENE